MSYTPINTQAYTAAYAGAIAGMAVSGWITEPDPAKYANVTIIAGAFAQAFDVAWNNSTQLNTLEQATITSVIQQDLSGRGPGPLDDTLFQNPNNWAITANACKALILESDTFFASQGITPAPTANGDLSVPNLATLVALKGIGFGQKFRVETVGRSYEFTPTGTSPISPIEVLTGIGGDWHSLVGTSDQKWLDEPSWYISNTGNDENNGTTIDSPIKTGNELWRRYNENTAQITQNVTIHLLTDIDNIILDYWLLSFSIVNNLRTLNISLTLIGEPTEILNSSIDTITQAIGNIPAKITAIGITDWTTGGPGGTTLIGTRGRITTGVNTGAVFWIIKANPNGEGNNTARISFACTLTESIVTLQAGDTFILESLPNIGLIDIKYRGYLFSGSGATNNRALIIQSINCGQMRIEGYSPFDAGFRAWGSYLFDDILILAAINNVGRPVLEGCKLGITNIGNWESVACFHTSAVGGSTRRLSNNNTQISNDIFQGLRVQNFSPYLILFGDCYIMDSTSFGFAAMPGSNIVCQSGTLKGSGNSFGIELHGDGQIDYRVGFVPTITGTSGDIKLFEQNVFITWSAVPWNDGLQQGTATLDNTGSITVPIPYLNPTQKITLGLNTIAGVGTRVSCPVALRTTTQFTLVGDATDRSSIDWCITPSGYNQQIIITQN